MTPQRAIAIVWKLRRLATSANLNEAASAAARAQQLIARYHLTDEMLARQKPSEKVGWAALTEAQEAFKAGLAKIREENADLFAQMEASRRAEARTETGQVGTVNARVEAILHRHGARVVRRTPRSKRRTVETGGAS